MSWFKKYGYAAVLIVVIAVIAWMVWGDMSGKGKMEKLGEAPNFTLTNMTGETVTMNNLDGNVRLLYFFFSHCPDVCQPTTYQLSKVQQGLEKEGVLPGKAKLMSVSFDPERDTLERLIEYSSNFHANPAGWYFLRGDEQETKEIAKSYGVAVLKDDQGNFIHQNYFLLIDGNGEIRKRINATEGYMNDAKFDQSIVKDIVRLIKETL